MITPHVRPGDRMTVSRRMATWWDDEGEVVAIRPSRPLNREPHVRMRVNTGITSDDHPDALEPLPREEAP